MARQLGCGSPHSRLRLGLGLPQDGFGKAHSVCRRVCRVCNHYCKPAASCAVVRRRALRAVRRVPMLHWWSGQRGRNPAGGQ